MIPILQIAEFVDYLLERLMPNGSATGLQRYRLIKGISVNYFSGEPVSRAEAREVGDAWAPYRTVATWFIWRSLDPLPVDY